MKYPKKSFETMLADFLKVSNEKIKQIKIRNEIKLRGEKRVYGKQN